MASTDAADARRKRQQDRRSKAWAEWSKAVAQAEADFAAVEGAELNILSTATSGAAAMLQAAQNAVTDAIARVMEPAEQMMAQAEQAVQSVVDATLVPARQAYDDATKQALDDFRGATDAARTVLNASLAAARARREAEVRQDALSG